VAGRESVDFALPPSRIALASGDVIGVTVGGRRHVVEIRAVIDAEARGVKAQSIDPGVFDMPLAAPRRLVPPGPAPVGPVQALLLDLPTLTADEPPVLLRLAVFA
jgi:Putative phage tail protein